MKNEIEFLIERYLDYQNLDEVGEEDVIRDKIDVSSLATEIVNFLYQKSFSFRPSNRIINGNYEHTCSQCKTPFGTFESKTGSQIPLNHLFMKEIFFSE